jgi:hypothetical protein
MKHLLCLITLASLLAAPAHALSPTKKWIFQHRSVCAMALAFGFTCKK